MHTYVDLALAWIRDAKSFLKDSSDPILAEAESYDYFRKIHKKTIVLPPVETPKTPPPIFERKKEEPPSPAPVIIEEAPPPPIIPLKKPAKKLDALFAKIAPSMPIFAEIPSDAIAKRIATRWKNKNQLAPITVIYFQESPEQKALLEEIAKALDVYFGPAALLCAESIEREKDWKPLLSVPELKLIITCDYTLWQLPNLCQLYKEVPQQKTRQLGEKPLFLLPDLSLYLKDPLLKRSLWKALCQTISSQLSPSTKN